MGEAAALSDFEIKRQLGEGAHGSVQLAVRKNGPNAGQTVALKIVRDDGSTHAARLEQQARAQQLVHPNIVPALESPFRVKGILGDEDIVLVLAYVPGMPLNRFLRDNGGWMEPLDALEIAEDIGSALAFAHEHGVIHRDLKPGNIIIDESGRAHLTDFGHAQLEESEHHLTVTGMQMGTPQYAAPELMTDAKRATAAADSYGLGAVIFHLVTGYYPHPDIPSVFSPPPSPSSIRATVPDAVDDLVLALMQPEVSERPADGTASLKRIKRAMEQLESAQ